MDIVRTWLLVAAERREFDGVLKRIGGASRLDWPGAEFAAEGNWNGDRWWMIANGPGSRLVSRALMTKRTVDGILSVGYCGGLDPALKIGDIVVSNDAPVKCSHPFVQGEIVSVDRVMWNSDDKAKVARAGIAVEMEAAEVRKTAAEWDVPFWCVKAVSDTAGANLPLNFNLYRDTEGRFSRMGIALAAVQRPFTVLPRLLEFAGHCRAASGSLGDFLADCKF